MAKAFKARVDMNEVDTEAMDNRGKMFTQTGVGVYSLFCAPTRIL